MPVRALSSLIGAVLLAFSPLTVAAQVDGGQANGTGLAKPAAAFVDVVRHMWATDIGLNRPQGIAFDPASGTLIVAGRSSAGSGVLQSISLLESLAAPDPLPVGMTVTASTSFDAIHGRLVTATRTDALVSVPTAGGRVTPGAPGSRAVVRGAAGLRTASGIAVNTAGETLVLASDGRLSVIADGSVTRQLSLAGAGEELRGLALSSDGHLFSIGAQSRALYEFDATGAVLSSRNLAALGILDPGGIAFAPSGDTNDAAATTNLYLADAGRPDGSAAAVYELSFTPAVMSAAAAAAPVSSVTLVNTINTGAGSALNPDSPDPSGLAYIPTSASVPASRKDRLVIADGEVEETNPPTGAGWHNVNVWWAPQDGSTQTATFDTTVSPTNPINKEPVGAAYDSARNELYIAKDGAGGRVWVYDASTMAQLRSFSVTVAPYNDADDEGLGFGNGILYMVDAIDNDLVKVQPGPDGVVGTGGDEVVTNYDLQQYGQTEPEGLDVHPVTGNIWIVSNKITNGVPEPMIEVTPDGALVSTASIAAANPNSAAGLAFAPPSNGSGGWNIYVSDRRIDNNTDRTENDGQIYEFSIDSLPPPEPDTTITSGPSGTVTSTDATFTFTGTSGTTSFECRLDMDITGFTTCPQPQTYTGLAPGPHTFEVRALAGTTPDPTPASRTWSIAQQPPPGNLLVNPGFETDANADGRPDSWTSKSFFTTVDPLGATPPFSAHEGNLVGRHLSTTDNQYNVSQDVAVTPGATYNFSGWVNIPSTSDAFSFKFRVQWLSSTGTIISTKTVKTYTASTGGAWDNATLSVAAPPGAVTARILMAPSSLNATIYVDDLAFGG